MSLKPETITQLETMIQADPALIKQLQCCKDTVSSAAVVAKAAAAKGVAVSESELLAHFEAAVAKQGTLSDAELEQVAGGGVTGAVIYSIATFGIGCVMGSVISELAAKGGCDKDLKNVIAI